MKNLRHYFVASLLALTLTVSAMAGEMPTAGISTPPSADGEMPTADLTAPATEILLSVIESILSSL